MRNAAFTPGRRARLLASALLLIVAAGTARAEPDEAAPAPDPIDRLLIAKGLMAAPAAAASAPVALAAAPPPAGLLRRARDRASDMVFAAMNFMGVRYRRGGDSADTGFDCSGFTRYVYEMSLGLVLPRRADEQASAPGLVAVPRNDLKPGDLVFFKTMKRTFSHVGIYIGGNRFIHAPRSGKDIRTDDLSFAYWAQRFTGARRAEAVVE